MCARRIALGVCLGLAGVSLWLRSGLPVYAIGGAAHDDQLFIRLAYFLYRGQWLGPYDQLTLAKGMGYPIFILTAFGASVPLKVAEQGFYLSPLLLLHCQRGL